MLIIKLLYFKLILEINNNQKIQKSHFLIQQEGYFTIKDFLMEYQNN